MREALPKLLIVLLGLHLRAGFVIILLTTGMIIVSQSSIAPSVSKTLRRQSSPPLYPGTDFI